MWSRIKPKKMYLTIFLYSCTAVSLLTLMFTWFLSGQFVRTALEEMDKSHEAKMKQVMKSSEFTLQQLRQFALRIYSDESIKLWLSMEKGAEAPLALSKAATSVREFMSSEPFIHAIYLINFDLDRIYTSDSSIYSTQDFYDPALLDYIQHQTTPYLQYVNHEVEGETYLALVVPSAGPRQSYQGYAAILFSKPLLKEYMLQVSDEDQNKLYIEGKNGEYILGNADPALAKELSAVQVPEGAAGWRWESGGETWSIRSEQLPIEGWKVYHLSPLSLWQAKVAKIRLEIIGSSVLLLAALLLFLYLQSYRSLKPLSDLAAHVKSRLGQGDPVNQSPLAGNEMALLHSGFQSLVERIEQLDLSMKSSQALIKDDFLRQWILSPRPSKPVREFIESRTPLLRTGWFRMAVIRLESYGRFTEQYDFASRKLLRFSMGNILSEVLANQGYAAETVDFGSDHIVAIVASPASEGEWEQVIAAAEEARVQIRQWLKFEVQAAVSPRLDAEENLPQTYHQLYELTLLRFIHSGEDKVYTREDLEGYERGRGSELDEALLKQVIHSVQLRNEKALEGYWDQLTHQMRELSYEECRLQLTHIIYTIMKSFKHHSVLHGMKSIHSFLDQFATLGEVQSWMYREMLKIMDSHRRKSGSNRKEEVAAEMIDYVRNHLHDPMLSVDDIAAHVSMSVNYARQIFKDQFGSSLSDFIAGQRIDYAAKLLTTTDWTVAEITEQSGFQTKSTFFAAFKRATGMTPNQYRIEKSSGASS
ncbi:AraC-like DNA-binding protein [Paenibacillus mucilaginosus]|uniref:AraC family transcriptional regulator n=1 Tax=Paenibacillus mucilaginosus TaxID=61624 RepID=UPI003D246698